jgi:hypothetical protein
MKFLILAVWLAVAQTGPPVPRQTPTNLTSGSNRNPQQSQKHARKTPLPTAIQHKEHAESAERDSGNKASEREQEHVVVERLPDKDRWDKVYVVLTGVLMLVGLLTFGAIIYQSIQTKRATVAMEKGTALQKAALRQWVVIQGFRDTVKPRFTNTTPQLDLHFFFEIANPTKMPLTLEWYVISINGTKYSSRLNFTLTPDKTHGLKVLMDYTDEIREKYIRDGYAITVTGVIAFTDALQEFQKQRFGYVYQSGPGKGETLNYEGPLPDEDIE